MSMLGKMKDMYQLQKQAKEIKKKLKNIHIEAEENGVTVVLTAEQEMISVKISEEAMQNREKLEKSVMNAMQKALKKSQEIASANMKEVMGQMGMDLPGT
ncbi:MAG: YbaB/EbfC family nucleoid-associated protein [Candidatus Gracilibacteria bacterium]